MERRDRHDKAFPFRTGLGWTTFTLSIALEGLVSWVERSLACCASSMLTQVRLPRHPNVLILLGTCDRKEMEPVMIKLHDLASPCRKNGHRHLSLKIHNVKFDIKLLLGKMTRRNLMSKIENECLA